MDDTFRELSPEEIKLATIQFMGQHLTGEMKELNKNIVGESSTLRSLSIDPVKVLQTVPGDNGRPFANVVNAGVNIPQQRFVPVQQPVQVQPIQQPVPDPNQLEFDFAKQASLLERIDSINSKLDKIINLLKKD